MRIVYVLTSLGIGGAERQTLAVALRMQRRGHVVALLVLRPQVAEQWTTPLPVVHLNMRRTTMSVLQGLIRGRRFLRQFRPELIHSHCFHANLIARVLRMNACWPRLLCTVHNVYEGGWHRMLLYRLTDPLATFTTTVSAAAMGRFVHNRALPKRKCMVVSNGIDVEEFSACADRRAAKRMEMSAREEFIWLAAGRIVPAKDLSNLLRAFAQLREIRLDARLWIAGAASDSEFTRVRALALELGLADSVCWLGMRRDVRDLMDAADGFVLASAWEGMPLVVGEAMAMGRLVAATEAGGVRELAGDTALVVPTRNPQALSQAMLQAMRMPLEERGARGRVARARIVQRFGMEAKAREWESVYASLLMGTLPQG